ncbi:MAG: sulfotransferase [Phycisphaera sp.]|nr:sulfotransferase [Phycisphaera sp.]
MIESPIFLVSSERSGSTLLRLMLDCHPMIAFNPESDYIVSQLPESGYPQMSRYHACLVGDRVFRHSGFTVDPSLDYPSLVNDFLEQKRRRDAKQLVGATVHHHFSRLHRIWPEARYIHLLRDGRDVSRSVVQMEWAGNLFVASDVWTTAEAEWDRLKPMLRADQWIEIRFEDVVSDCNQAMARLCDWIGVSYSDKIYDYAASSTYDVPDARLAYQWKQKIGRDELAVLEARIGDLLQTRGYELSGVDRRVLTRSLCWSQRLHSKLVTARRTVRRYGCSLYLQERISRWLGLRAWHDRVQLKIDRIIDDTLK